MSQTTLFILFAIGLVIFALILVLPALFRLSTPAHDDRKRENILAARARLNDLNARKSVAGIDPIIASECEQEIEGQLLTEVDSKAQLHIPLRRDNLALAIIVVTLVVFPPLLYLAWGTPSALSTPLNMAELIMRLESRVADSPDGKSLLQLARIFAIRNEIDKAIHYYTGARTLLGDPPDLLAEHINMLMRYAPDYLEIETLIQTGLNTYPQHPMILWLAGLYAENHGDIEATISYWQLAHEQLSGDPMQQRVAEAIIAVEEKFLEQQKQE